MVLHDEQYEAYIQILKEELIPAFGCTEPIALAYAASIARQELGKNPSQVRVEVSGNIIKNVKSVIVPNIGRLLRNWASAKWQFISIWRKGP